MENGNKKLEDSLIRISIKFPYFTRLITRLKYEEVPSSQLPTMGVDSNEGIVYYNSEFINSLTNDELDFVVMHEILHVVHRHCSEREVKTRSHEENNISMDLEINSVIKEKILFGTPVDGGCYPSDYGLPELYTHEWYLERLPKLAKLSLAGLDISISISINSKSTKNSDGDSNSDSNENEVQNDKNKNSLNKAINDIIDKLDLDKKLVRVSTDSNKSTNQSNCSDLDDLDDLTPEISPGGGSSLHKNKSRKILKYFTFYNLLKKLFKDKYLSKYDYSYTKLNRRMQDNTFIFPGKFGIEKNRYVLAIVMDVSGSMTSYISKMTQSLIKFYNDYKLTYMLDIDIYICEDHAFGPIPIKKFINDGIEYRGWGNYIFYGYELAVKNKKDYSDIIILTDAVDNSLHEFRKYNKRCFIALPKEYKYQVDYINGFHNKNLIPVIMEE